MPKFLVGHRLKAGQRFWCRLSRFESWCPNHPTGSSHGRARTDQSVFSGNSNLSLASDICEELGVSLGKAEVSRFSDGEVQIDICESVRGADCFLIQSTSNPANEHLMEMLVMVDALKKSFSR